MITMEMNCNAVKEMAIFFQSLILKTDYMSHEPSLMALAPTSLLLLSGRTSEQVIGRS